MYGLEHGLTDYYWNSRLLIRRFTNVMRRHGHKGPLDIQLQDDDGEVLADDRFLFTFSNLFESRRQPPLAFNVALWGLSLVLGGTRGFEIKGGYSHWKIVLGGPGAERDGRTLEQALNGEPSDYRDVIPKVH
jgi:hypothetical protein